MPPPPPRPPRASTLPWRPPLAPTLLALLLSLAVGCSGAPGRAAGARTRRPVSVDRARLPPWQVVQLAAGRGFTCARLADGRVHCWGDNQYGQLVTPATRHRPTAAPIPGVTQAVALAAGSLHACAALDDGRVMCWGDNVRGQLGDGDAAVDAAPAASFDPAALAGPVLVADLDGAIGVGAGGVHSCALLASGAITCWGSNRVGQLGDGSILRRALPTPVLRVHDASRLSLGGQHSCAVRASGEIACWGGNDTGQLGDGSFLIRPTPVRVLGVSDAIDLDVSASSFGCALRATGHVVCWGDNESGQLGDTSSHLRPRPVEVPGLDGVRQVVVGEQHACALISNRTVRCWGHRGHALGVQGPEPDPEPVAHLTDVVQLAAGAFHTCALRRDGQVLCWGFNKSGQLGDGGFTDRLLPVAVVGLPGPPPPDPP